MTTRREHATLPDALDRAGALVLDEGWRYVTTYDVADVPARANLVQRGRSRPWVVVREPRVRGAGLAITRSCPETTLQEVLRRVPGGVAQRGALGGYHVVWPNAVFDAPELARRWVSAKLEGVAGVEMPAAPTAPVIAGVSPVLPTGGPARRERVEARLQEMGYAPRIGAAPERLRRWPGMRRDLMWWVDMPACDACDRGTRVRVYWRPSGALEYWCCETWREVKRCDGPS